jgi:hypothetical protein
MIKTRLRLLDFSDDFRTEYDARFHRPQPGTDPWAGGFAVRWLNQRVFAFSTTAATEWF